MGDLSNFSDDEISPKTTQSQECEYCLLRSRIERARCAVSNRRVEYWHTSHSLAHNRVLQWQLQCDALRQPRKENDVASMSAARSESLQERRRALLRSILED